MKFIATILILILLNVIQVSNVRASGPIVEFNIPDRNKVFPTDELDQGVVYGTAIFEIKAKGGASVSKRINGLFRAISQTSFKNKEGSYLVTLELIRGDKVLSRTPIISAAYSGKKYLFFTTSSSFIGSVTTGMKILDDVIIDSSNNDMHIVLKTYFREKETFDVKAMEHFAAIAKDIKKIMKLNVPPVYSELIQKMSTSMKEIMTRSTEAKITFKIPMSFAKLAGEKAWPRRINFNIKFKYKERTLAGNIIYSGTLPIEFRLLTKKSKYKSFKIFRETTDGNEITVKKFVNPIPSKLYRLRIVIGGESKQIIRLISKNGSPKVRDFISSLKKSPKTEIEDAEQKCESLFEEFRKHLTVRDAFGLYWAFLWKFKNKFPTNAFQTCSDLYQDEMNDLGLLTSKLEEK